MTSSHFIVPKWLKTPLHYATLGGYTRTVSLLVEGGADIEIANKV
jgi:ankyrin repeat protein